MVQFLLILLVLEERQFLSAPVRLFAQDGSRVLLSCFVLFTLLCPAKVQPLRVQVLDIDGCLCGLPSLQRRLDRKATVQVILLRTFRFLTVVEIE